MLGEVDVVNIDVNEMYDDMLCSTMSIWEDVLRTEGCCMSRRIWRMLYNESLLVVQ